MRTFLERRPITTSVIYTAIGALPMYLASAQVAQIQQDITFGPRQLGFVVATFFMVSAVGSKTVGPRIDRDGATRGLRRSAALTCAACAAIAVGAHHWVVLAVLLGAVGLANSYGQIGSNLVIASLVRQGRQGAALSAKQSAVPLSSMLAGIGASLISAPGGWRWTYVAVALLSLVLLVACPRFPPMASGQRAMRADRNLTPALLVLMVGAGIAGGVGNSIAAFTADAAVATGFSPAIAGLLLTAGSLVAIISRISAGLTADRRGRSGFLETTSLLSIGVIGLLILATLGTRPAAFVGGLLLTFMGAWGWAGVMVFLVVRTVPVPPATSTGAIAAATYFGTVVVPPIVGIVAERASYTTVFAGQSVLLAGAVLAVVLGHRLGHSEDPRVD